ncbi:phosphatidate cytidylyltransferase [Saprolegnia parasitica CBS 223.65]|uniref:Phosphatidate cytidylyltransferase n=1 Tax=Saprolegnia parasitica (strain CBS 223.65) TaxID=695850 RepID=A0A067D6A4_SAPPC|nr:phosphatidate cytidylyltransferase [Saprolegnia parasitica CBS 223.65]KDO34176.1 phosphatidate cytidylyltransferase [Saprolegnia parasitica CBS 223.65]|eukprot:XP_012195224.1 phosphatidate cytidylyltransferase [Saprolegnia parasitica CBS 223.65]
MPGVRLDTLVAEHVTTEPVDDDVVLLEAMTSTSIGTKTQDAMRTMRESHVVRRIRRSNAIQRVLSGLVLAPSVLIFVLLGPPFAPYLLCSVVVSICYYEFAWLSHRIVHRVATSVALSDLASLQPIPVLNLRDCAISPLSRGYDKLAAALASTLQTSLLLGLTQVAHRYYWHFQSLPADLEQQRPETQAVAYLYLYLGVTGWVAFYCAWLTPSWRSHVLLLTVQLFYGLRALHAFGTNYYSNHMYIPSPDYTKHVFALIAIAVHCSGASTTSPPDAIRVLFGILLDCVGYGYVALLMDPIAAFMVSVVDGRRLALGFLAVVWGADTGAYITGHVIPALGYVHFHRLADHISPKKDVEGTLGGAFLGILLVLLVNFVAPPDLPDSVLRDLRMDRDTYLYTCLLWQLVFAVVGAVISRYGDLLASLIKRLAQVKDTGDLIPGHGGMLDRVDALLFTAAVFVLYHRLSSGPNYTSYLQPTYLGWANQASVLATWFPSVV